MFSKLQDDLKTAQLARDELRVSTLRLLLSEIKNAQIQKGVGSDVLSEQEIISVIQKEAKKRKEAATLFHQGNKEDLALKEETELKILEEYLPSQLSDEELTNIVSAVINETGASTIQDMGRMIGAVKAKVGNGAEGGRISEIVKSKLT